MIAQPSNAGTFPHNTDFEKRILGGLLLNPDAYHQMSFLHTEDFYHNRHKTIFEAITRIIARGDDLDPLTVDDEIEQMGRRADLPEATYVWGLSAFAKTARGIETYARRIVSLANCGRIIAAFQTTIEEAYEGREEEATAYIETLLYSLRTQEKGRGALIHAASLSDAFLDKLDVLSTHTVTLTGVPTGFTDLDRLLHGLQRADLVILAARPAIGKSACAISIARNAAKAGHGVAVFSLEMSNEQLWQRLVSIESGVPLELLRTGRLTDEHWEQVTDALARLSAVPLYFDDSPGTHVKDIESKVKRLVAEGVSIGLVVVDYLQLMRSSGQSEGNRVQEVSEISRTLKLLARELNVPILALAQLSRSVETRQSKVPQLSDLRESGGIENDADIVMFIYRDEVYNPDTDRKGQADIIVAKHRSGSTGEVALFFKPELTSFHTLEVTPDVEVPAWEN